MKIDIIEFTKDEINEAVQDYLDWRGIKVNVINISSVGYPIHAWQVELKTKSTEVERIQSSSSITSPEQLGAAIEKGEL